MEVLKASIANFQEAGVKKHGCSSEAELQGELTISPKTALCSARGKRGMEKLEIKEENVAFSPVLHKTKKRKREQRILPKRYELKSASRKEKKTV